MTPAIRFAGVGHAYAVRNGAPVQALAEVTFDVAPQEFVAVVGPSGCGKSTLLRMVAGLLTPSRGSVQVRGAAPATQQASMALAFQKPTLLPWFDVLGNVLFPLKHRGLRIGSVERDRAMDLLAMMGLDDFAKRRPDELSGGMQQRVALCRALVTEPEILLLDEPFSALDALTRDELGFELLRLGGARPRTVVLITHSVAEAVMLADRVLVMSPRPGRIAAEIIPDLPRPRGPEVTRLPAFQEAINDVRDTITRSGAARLPGLAA
ncbi:ABC transporter ATP-binding protein [Roseomonas sp. F4]